jgi:lipoprotein-anchoring transpeptidase ErfK/SrfK
MLLVSCALEKTESVGQVEKADVPIEKKDSAEQVKKADPEYITHVVKSGDSLLWLAKKYGTTLGLIFKLNDIKNPTSIKPKMKLKIMVLKDKMKVVIDRKTFSLALLYEDKIYQKYPIGIGAKETETPVGSTFVSTKLIRPPWTRPGQKTLRFGDPGYPLGERWIGFDKTNFAGLGIHGTNDKTRLNKMSTNGCIVMLDKDVVELYDCIIVSTQVEIK